jgi:uncharacterized SAM-binding protein YcdF (DUF218 family)/glycosyltransferase involved in cell wall biosynthesis
MLHSQNIICISSIDWDFIWQGHQEIMSTFARNGNRVLFIENTGVRAPTLHDLPRLKKRLINWAKGVRGIRREKENLYIFSPVVLPFPYSRIARWINRHILLFYLNRWMKFMDFNDPILWTFLPTGLTLDMINNINKKLTVYYCIDNFAVSSSSARKVSSTEKKLIRQSDLVYVTSQELHNHCSRYNQRVYTFPFGVNIESFEKLRSEEQPHFPEDLRAIENPIIGYIGGIHRWIDQNLIRALAENHQDYAFVFVGPIQTDVSRLSEIENVHFLGHKPHELLPYYVNSFSVGIIPYLLTDYTKNVYPTKLNEYLALGKPVVSTKLPEITAFNEKYGNIVSIGKDPEEFSSCLERAVNIQDNKQAIEKMIRVAHDNTWRKRIEQMSDLIEEGVERRKHDKDLKWKEYFRKFYRKTRRRLVIAGIVCLLLYLLSFHTPLLWLVASPLKISQAPRIADVIVTFAGGVGESGKAGEGYRERVTHSVNLYKKGFAHKMIFSTGYVYVMQEAEVMKALAVYLGVPSEDIILEKRAGSTYQNVKFTKDIMEKHGWDSALVVSSPYNMRRIIMVYNKIAPEIEVTLTPVPKSGFYGDEKKVKWKHIKAIAHEYMGIIYYWLKHYI